MNHKVLRPCGYAISSMSLACRAHSEIWSFHTKKNANPKASCVCHAHSLNWQDLQTYLNVAPYSPKNECCFAMPTQKCWQNALARKKNINCPTNCIYEEDSSRQNQFVLTGNHQHKPIQPIGETKTTKDRAAGNFAKPKDTTGNKLSDDGSQAKWESKISAVPLLIFKTKVRHDHRASSIRHLFNNMSCPLSLGSWPWPCQVRA